MDTGILLLVRNVMMAIRLMETDARSLASARVESRRAMELVSRRIVLLQLDQGHLGLFPLPFRRALCQTHLASPRDIQTALPGKPP